MNILTKENVMSKKSESLKTDDASGRGSVEGYKVPFPGRMHGYTEEGIQAVLDVMRNSDGQTQGKYMRQFESDFKAYTGANHAFAMDNATNALRLAGVICGLKPGDEVIVPAYTFCATGIAFGQSGAKLVWADINPKTWVADPTDIERKITSRTKVLVVVHLLGMPVDMQAIMTIAKKYSLKVVEDCAQAPGASINGKKVGTFGNFGCFSWHGAKNMSTLGEGGMLTVKDDADASLVPGLRHNGVRGFEGERERYWVPAMSNVDIDIDGVWPNNFCIGEAQCALGSAELRSLDKINDTLIAQADKFKKGLSDVPEIEFAQIPAGYRHIFHQFVMHFNGSTCTTRRNDLMDILVNKYKMRCIVQYYPLYRFPLFQKMGFGGHACPTLDAWWDDSFSFPWWCGMTDETITYMVESVKAAVKTLKRGK